MRMRMRMRVRMRMREFCVSQSVDQVAVGR